uniref:Uncharacterized protein n=1 Tax=Otus sunia TaxID=257818 RepID=A0A8C8AL41_9STRI
MLLNKKQTNLPHTKTVPFLFRNSIQNQMQSKGGYGGGISENVQMQLVDTQAG